jgi:hypothetical protein
MSPDRLQQLRDIHLPIAPGWWPPAPGWWAIGLIAAALLIWATWRLQQRRLQRRPLRETQRLYADVYRRHQAGELTHRAYLNASNELLKRLLIHGLKEQRARRASGEAWLRLLDRHAGGSAFTQGPGRALGDDRFRPDMPEGPTAVTDSVHMLVTNLLDHLASARRPRAT